MIHLLRYNICAYAQPTDEAPLIQQPNPIQDDGDGPSREDRSIVEGVKCLTENQTSLLHIYSNC